MKKNEIVIIIILLILAFAVRIWGIGFGLPEIYTTDEWFEVKRALKLGTFSFDMERVTKGWFFYLLFFEYGIYYFLLKIFGTVKNSGEFLFKILNDPTEIWLIGRVSSAILGTISCLFIYKICKTLKNNLAGIFGALFLIFNLIHVKYSHLISVDIPLVFFISLVILIAIKEEQQLKWNYYFLLGIFLAFAAMAKITALSLLPPLVIYLYLKEKTNLKKADNIKKISIFMISFTICYLVGNPGIIIRLKDILAWGASKLISTVESNGPEFPISYNVDSKFLFYLENLVPVKSLLLVLFIVPGIYWLGKKYRNKNFLLVSYVILNFLVLSFSKDEEHVYARYLMPILPVIGIYFGFGVSYVVGLFYQSTIKKSIAYLLVLTALLPSIADSLEYSYRLNLRDTRDVGKEWVFQNISKDSLIAIEGTGNAPSNSTIQLKISPEIIEKRISGSIEENEKKDLFYKTIIKINSNHRNFQLVFTSREGELKKAIEKDAIDYVILRKKTIDTFKYSENKINFPEVYSLIEKIENGRFQLVQKFEPSQKITGPEIYVYKRLR